MKPSVPRRLGPPPKPSVNITDDAIKASDDVLALDLMGRLLDLGITPEQTANAMSLLAQRRSVFVTELVKADK